MKATVLGVLRNQIDLPTRFIVESWPLLGPFACFPGNDHGHHDCCLPPEDKGSTWESAFHRCSTEQYTNPDSAGYIGGAGRRRNLSKSPCHPFPRTQYRCAIRCKDSNQIISSNNRCSCLDLYQRDHLKLHKNPPCEPFGPTSNRVHDCS